MKKAKPGKDLYKNLRKRLRKNPKEDLLLWKELRQVLDRAHLNLGRVFILNPEREEPCTLQEVNQCVREAMGEQTKDVRSRLSKAEREETQLRKLKDDLKGAFYSIRGWKPPTATKSNWEGNDD